MDEHSNNKSNKKVRKSKKHARGNSKKKSSNPIFNAENKNFSFDEHNNQQEDTFFNSNQFSQATNAEKYSNKLEQEEAFKEMFREKMQIQLFGSVDGVGSESKKLQVNSALKEAFQRNFSKGNMFPFVDEGFSAIN